jgi:hypothetical protein
MKIIIAIFISLFTLTAFSQRVVVKVGSNGGGYVLPVLKSGSVLFYNGTDISQDTTNLFWNATNKWLGIGIHPSNALEVAYKDNSSANINGFVLLDSAGFQSNFAVQGSPAANSYQTILSSLANGQGYLQVFSPGASAYNVLNTISSSVNFYVTASTFAARVNALSFASNGNASLASLKTGSIAPSTSGTTKILVSDANGLVSNVTAIPNGTAAATQATTDSSNLPATTAFVKQYKGPVTNLKGPLQYDSATNTLEINPDTLSLWQSQRRPYTTYVAAITQSGTSAPTAIVSENNTGFTFTYSYVSVGHYLLTCSGTAFATSHSYVSIQNQAFAPMALFEWTSNGTTQINLFTRKTDATSVDGELNGEIEIRIYP